MNPNHYPQRAGHADSERHWRSQPGPVEARPWASTDGPGTVWQGPDDPYRVDLPHRIERDTPVGVAESETVRRATFSDAAVRREALSRVLLMNKLHARNAWELRRRDPIAPHGLALLYGQHELGARFLRVTAATRYWLAGNEARDLPDRLYRFYQGLTDLIGAGVDPRDVVANRRDEQMRPDAFYLGLGVSSLDTSTGDWADLLATAQVPPLPTQDRRTTSLPAYAPVEGADDIPGCVRVLLTDGTTIVAERRGRAEFGHRIISCTHTLNVTTYESPYPWSRVTPDDLAKDREHAETLRWMSALSDLFWQADQALKANQALTTNQSSDALSGQSTPTGTHPHSQPRRPQ